MDWIFSCFFAGMGIGLFYFGGLWMTVSRIRSVRHPAVLSLVSFWGRTVLSLWGFYLIMDRNWVNLLVCLAGFLLARWIMIRRLRPA
ncbi:ATP synthase subunit I [Desulforhabdus amnigena]|uniref:ATP synthase subunit I n=1 Tax=Desulforhabdus amnigena TaxID=40218 RepID=UPI00168DC4CD|nr:ATP synthase subunit I [Desulforhabdus amnigena]NLJ29055.1 ATP synthase subunit I [Deltaproteobacteria bacterium]